MARARRSIRNGASSNQGCRHLRVSLMDAVARHRRSQSVDVFVGDGTSSDARSRKGSCVTLCDSLSVDCSRTRRGLTASPLPHVSIPRPEVPAARVVHRPSLHLTYNVGHLNFAIKFIHLSTSHFMMLPILKLDPDIRTNSVPETWPSLPASATSARHQRFVSSSETEPDSRNGKLLSERRPLTITAFALSDL